MQCAIIQQKSETIDRDVLLQAMVEAGKLNRTDAIRAARYCQGILGVRYSVEQAKRIAGQLREHGYSVQVIASKSIPRIGKPRPVRWLRMTDEWLQVPWDLHDNFKSIDWSCVFVICSGLASEDATIRNGSPRRIVQPDIGSLNDESDEIPPADHARKLALVTDVIAVDESANQLHFRLSMSRTLYPKFPEIPPQTTPFIGFRDITRQMIDRSKHAIISDETRSLTNMDQMDPEAFSDTTPNPDSRDVFFDNYKLWLLLLVMLHEHEAME